VPNKCGGGGGGGSSRQACVSSVHVLFVINGNSIFLLTL